jgi:hypothetical protein
VRTLVEFRLRDWSALLSTVPVFGAAHLGAKLKFARFTYPVSPVEKFQPTMLQPELVVLLVL